jgi:DNA-binding NarL/FixJ family response regulator
MVNPSTIAPRETPPRAASTQCPACDGHPIVALAIRHLVMRRFTRELLERDHRGWVIVELDYVQMRGGALRALAPDVLVVDGGPFPACCQAEIAQFPPNRVVVVGGDPDAIYATTALTHGAGAWIPADQTGDQLEPAMRRVLSGTRDRCDLDEQS